MKKFIDSVRNELKSRAFKALELSAPQENVVFGSAEQVFWNEKEQTVDFTGDGELFWAYKKIDDVWVNVETGDARPDEKKYTDAEMRRYIREFMINDYNIEVAMDNIRGGFLNATIAGAMVAGIIG